MYKLCDDLYPYEAFAITTDRLRLSVYKRSRAQHVADYLKRNRTFHKKWSQTQDDKYFTVKMQREYLKYDYATFKQGQVVPLWVTLKDDPSTVIGKVSYFNFAYGGMMSCSLGYHLDENYLHKGYITEGIMAGNEMLVDLMKIHRIEAFILPENEASHAVIKRCGFTREGERISYMHINGKWRDHIAYYILENSIRK